MLVFGKDRELIARKLPVVLGSSGSMTAHRFWPSRFVSRRTVSTAGKMPNQGGGINPVDRARKNSGMNGLDKGAFTKMRTINEGLGRS
jgi:hypothetical protein